MRRYPGTRKLTTRFGIETRLIALHDHNEQQMVEGVLACTTAENRSGL